MLLILLGSIGVWLFLSTFLYKTFFKRFYDVFLCFAALVLFSPLFFVLSLVGAIAMKGNPFFIQKRPGKKDKKGKEKVFKLIKFRTMSNAKDRDGNLLPDEKRLNGYGRFLRSTSLDEFPEVLNILIGDMSIIGPRPQLIKDLVFMDDKQRERHNVRPGLTGLAQINGRNNISWEKKFEYDLQYLKNVSFWGDCSIFFKTIGKILRKSDVVREGTDSDIDFGEWLLEEGKITKEYYMIKLEEANR